MCIVSPNNIDRSEISASNLTLDKKKEVITSSYADAQTLLKS